MEEENFIEEVEKAAKYVISKIGITRKNKSKSKKNLKIEKRSRKINRSKKGHKVTKKEKKL